jgi:predicted secreted hydrolase
MKTASLLLLATLCALGPRQDWAVIEPGLEIELPADHGVHADHRTEWWYVTGNVEDAEGRRFGYQLTFFRSGLGPGPRAPRAGSSALRADQVWAGHLALVDVERGETRFAERLRRGGSALVVASATDLDLSLEDWSLARGADDTLRLYAADPAHGVELDLELSPVKAPVLHGDGGVSAKGDEPGNASAYVTWTRLRTSGRILLDGRPHEVAGASWLDHEWGTSQLGRGVVGWDWFGLQLDDGRELMVYVLRREDGTPHRVSAGTLVQADGGLQHLERDDFRLTARDTWTSPRTGAVYPARWRLEVLPADLSLDIRPLVASCELVSERSTDVTYWEGPVRVSGSANGRGYAELVGYAHPMTGRF